MHLSVVSCSVILLDTWFKGQLTFHLVYYSVTFQCIVRLGIRVLYLNAFRLQHSMQKVSCHKLCTKLQESWLQICLRSLYFIILIKYISHEVILILLNSSSFSLIHIIHHKRNNTVNKICRNWQNVFNSTVLGGILKRKHVAPKQSRTCWSWTKKNDVNCLFHFTF